MRRVAIGVCVHAEPHWLRATIDSVGEHTSRDVELLLLPDGPDEETASALRTMRHLPQHGTSAPLGGAACLNRLARSTDADVLVLLESGCLVGPGWLDRMLAAMDADPRHGLAGPSTNNAWNEQRTFPDVGNPDAGLEDTAAEALRRFGNTWRTLEPLYSLADFCYVVRREVFESVGDADERYSLGPCWEMDFNVRAARSGWRGVWACSSFVWRAPSTPRRQREERARFEASKRLYQDKFCALRLRAERPGYEPHCRGEACEHFASAALIEIRRSTVRTPAAAPAPAPAVTVSRVEPLVSCVMPTRDRVDFALQAVRYFQRQDYGERELIILDDGSQDLGLLLPDDPKVRHVRLTAPMTIGAKRNQGVELARGDLVVHWDDDDWYAPTRLRAQVAPLVRGAADICGLVTGMFLELPAWEFWRCTPALHRRLFVHDVHGGTLAYHRRVWAAGARYPDLSLAEDAVFLKRAVVGGARLLRIPGDDLFVYVRHGENTWRFACGSDVHGSEWVRVAEPESLLADRSFYAARSDVGKSARSNGAFADRVASPSVSCVMPTVDRPCFAARAIDYFQRQDFASRELIVVDDGAAPIRDLVPDDSRIRYVHLDRRHSLGAKRNIACELAQGEFIAHWDDDDWMANSRISRQVAALRADPNAQFCGLDRVLYYEPATRRAWEYVYPPDGRPWVAGGTLCYRKSLWKGYRFPEVTEGEDTRFVWSLRGVPFVTTASNTFYVAIVHGQNTSPKRTSDPRWLPIDPESVRALLRADIPFYDAQGWESS